MYLTNEEFIILKGFANGLSREEINKPFKNFKN